MYVLTDDSQVITLTLCDHIVSTQSDDTELLSSPSSSVSTRTQMWPCAFPVPTFSYDTELQLENGTAVFRSNFTRLTHTAVTWSDQIDLSWIKPYNDVATRRGGCHLSEYTCIGSDLKNGRRPG